MVGYCVSIFFLNLYHDELIRILKRGYLFLYTLIEYLSFILLIAGSVKNKRAKIIILLISLLFVAFLFLLNFVFPYDRYDSIPIAAETLILLIVSIYFFYEQFKDTSTLYIYHQYSFWLTIGILVYLCGSLFIFALAEQMSPAQITEFWYWTYIVEIIKNILFTVGILMYVRKPFVKPPKTDIPYLDIKELS
jgi:hypothetical protein